MDKKQVEATDVLNSSGYEITVEQVDFLVNGFLFRIDCVTDLNLKRILMDYVRELMTDLSSTKKFIVALDMMTALKFSCDPWREYKSIMLFIECYERLFASNQNLNESNISRDIVHDYFVENITFVRIETVDSNGVSWLEPKIKG